MTVDIINSDVKDYMNGSFVIDFYAEWCQPCKNMEPLLEKIAKDHEHLVIGKCNIEENDDLIEEYGIRNIPTLVFIKDGKVVDRFTGTKTLDQLTEKVNLIL